MIVLKKKQCCCRVMCGQGCHDRGIYVFPDDDLNPAVMLIAVPAQF